MVTYSSILAWRVLWTEEPGGQHTARGVAELDTTETANHTCMHGGTRVDILTPSDVQNG